MNEKTDWIARYFTATGAAFRALDQIFPADNPWAKRHNLIHGIVNEHVYRLRQSFQTWELYCRYSANFRIDTKESGLPAFLHAMELSTAEKDADAKLEKLATPDTIRNQMLDEMLKYKRFPSALQKEMAERLYYESTRDRDLFRDHNAPVTVRWSFNKKSERPFYVVHWSAYDGTANLPLIYIAVIEDSSPTSWFTAGKFQNKDAGDSKKERIPGLPNKDLSAEFESFVANHSAYSLNLTSIASALDKDFAKLHPKQLRRIILGPFYSGGITKHNEQVQSVLDGVSGDEDAWLLTWTAQELYSKQEKPAKWGLLGGSQAEEIYYVNTDDLECAQQGVSAFERHALIPHEAYQAVFALEKADEVFEGYQRHIVNREEILRHV